MTEAEQCKLDFEEWAEAKGFVLDELFMSSDGVPKNPYCDDKTRLAFEIWLASREGMHIDCPNCKEHFIRDADGSVNACIGA